MTKRISVLLVLCSLFWPGCIVAAEGATQVRVTGVGWTIDAARADAIRVALMAVVKQLVIAKQLAEGERLLVDSISSSMNGYLEDFVVDRVEETSLGIRLHATVTVSSTRLANYLGESIGAELRVKRDSAIEIERIKLIRRSNASLIGEILRDFPVDALITKAFALELDQIELGRFRYRASVQIRPDYVDSLRASMKAIGGKRIATTDGATRGDLYPNTPTFLLCLAERLHAGLLAQKVRFRLGMLDGGECYRMDDVDLSTLTTLIPDSRVNAVSFAAGKPGISLKLDGNPIVVQSDAARRSPPVMLMVAEAPLGVTLLLATAPATIDGSFVGTLQRGATVEAVPVMVDALSRTSDTAIERLIP